MCVCARVYECLDSAVIKSSFYILSLPMYMYTGYILNHVSPRILSRASPLLFTRPPTLPGTCTTCAQLALQLQPATGTPVAPRVGDDTVPHTVHRSVNFRAIKRRIVLPQFVHSRHPESVQVVSWSEIYNSISFLFFYQLPTLPETVCCVHIHARCVVQVN